MGSHSNFDNSASRARNSPNKSNWSLTPFISERKACQRQRAEAPVRHPVIEGGGVAGEVQAIGADVGDAKGAGVVGLAEPGRAAPAVGVPLVGRGVGPRAA